MTTYYYLEDPNDESRFTSIPEDDYISTILSIAKEQGVKITDKMVLDRIFKKSSNKNPKKKKELMFIWLSILSKTPFLNTAIISC